MRQKNIATKQSKNSKETVKRAKTWIPNIEQGFE